MIYEKVVISKASKQDCTDNSAYAGVIWDFNTITHCGFLKIVFSVKEKG